jgi:hypothetical protein
MQEVLFILSSLVNWGLAAHPGSQSFRLQARHMPG